MAHDRLDQGKGSLLRAAAVEFEDVEGGGRSGGGRAGTMGGCDEAHAGNSSSMTTPVISRPVACHRAENPLCLYYGADDSGSRIGERGGV